MAKRSKTTERPGSAWLNRHEMCAVFDIGPKTWENTYRRYASPESQKLVNGTRYYHARSVLDSWSKAQALKSATGIDDPMLLVGDSPALERYRNARARLSEIEVAAKEKSFVAVSDIEPPLMGLTVPLREAGDALARQFGNHAAAILNQAVQRWADALPKLLPAPELEGVTR